MPQTNQLDTGNYIIIALVVLIALALIVVGSVLFYNDFSRELQHLNTEIRRTEGEELDYWKKRRRRLWLSILPFVKYK